MAEEIIIFCS